MVAAIRFKGLFGKNQPKCLFLTLWPKDSLTKLQLSAIIVRIFDEYVWLNTGGPIHECLMAGASQSLRFAISMFVLYNSYFLIRYLTRP